MALVWQEVTCVPEAYGHVYPDRMSRAKVPGGWLIFVWSKPNNTQSITFLPDPDHAWNGSSPA